MAWIKRNLFFVLGGLIAVGLLGAAGFYNYQSWSRNSAALDKLHEITDTLKNLASQQPSPGNKKINNIETAKEQEVQVRAWIQQARQNFQSIPPIPSTGTNLVSSEEFAASLRITIDQLQREAVASSVTLPPDFDFSFAAERPLVKFAANSLSALPVQLGEVKTITEIIYDARVNSLDGIQRSRVADDDAAGSQADYIDEPSVTNELAVLTPYLVTFRAFSPEIARVLKGFAASDKGFIVKGLNVQPAGNEATGGPGPMPGYGGGPYGPGPYGPGPYPGQMQQPPGQPGMPAPGKGGLQTVLKEQMLRITIEVEIVKLLPKN